MNLKGNSNQERAVDALIHNTSGSIGSILNNINFIESRLKELGVKDDKISEWIIRIKESRKYLYSNIDIYYTRFKNDFSDESMGITTKQE